MIEKEPILLNAPESSPREENIWQPLERKNFPSYIEERFEALNRIEELDFSEIEKILAKPEFGPVKPEVVSYLSFRLKQERKNPTLSEEAKEKALYLLRRLIRDKNWEVRAAVASGLGDMGKPSLPLLEKLSRRDKNLEVRAAAIFNLGKMDEASLPILKELAGDKNLEVRAAVAFGLGNIDEPGLPLLKKLAGDKNWEVRAAVASNLGKMGEASLPILKELAGDKNPDVRRRVVYSLEKMGKPGLPLLKELAERDGNPNMRREAAFSITKIETETRVQTRDIGIGHQQLIHDLITSQEPALLNPLTKEVIYDPERQEESPLLKLSDVIENLRKDYPELVGLVVLGSLSKGYWRPGNDLDWGLVFDGENPISASRVEKIKSDFKRLAREAAFPPCLGEDHRSLVASKIPRDDYVTLEIVFNGLFFGDRKRMVEVQTEILSNINQNRWRRIQDVWINNLNNYDKMVGRFGLSEGETTLIKNLRVLLWRLPDLETMRKEIAGGAKYKT